jgi:transcription elongation factor SPT6
LVESRAEKVSQIWANVQEAETRKADILASQGPILQVAKKACLDLLWNSQDYLVFLGDLTEMRHILDVHSFVNLVKEGNDSIRAKEAPSVDDGGKKSDGRKRSRRFDRDFYRTCVAEGLRGICYRFLLSPHRVGIKLEDTERSGRFDFSKVLPGEENKDGAGDPHKWDAPLIPTTDPMAFASDLVSSGDLVLLSTSHGAEPDDNEARDPLRGCRYVAAMELAHEPRVRMYMRNIYRKHALLTTRPSKKGMENIDAFHDYYGLHLLKGKPIKEHFPPDENEIEALKANLGPHERKELESEMQEREKNSCLQYLNLLKAEKTGDITVHVHMPYLEQNEEWFKEEAGALTSRENQDLSVLVKELAKVYLPTNADSDEWNNERRKVIRLAILSFLLPQFEAEVRRDLREAAVKIGVLNAAYSLKGMAMEGPYRPAALASTENRFLHPTGDLPVVGVCCSSDNKDASYLASVTERGELNDHLAIPSGTRIDNDKMREKIITFLLQCRPSVVLVGTSGGFDSRLMVRKLGEMVTEAVQRWNRRDIQREDEDDEEFEARQAAFRQNHPTSHLDDDDLEWKCNVDLIDDGVAQLFGRSIRGKKEFPDASVSMKCAIATARHGKDPLAELAYAWSVASDAGVFGTEMLFLNIHPLQQILPKTLLLRHYERVLCEVVSEVGVDVNTACTFDHMHGLLSLVPGLGPRKAANIRQSVTRIGGVVASRRALLEKRLMGPVVYNNSVAFLRIREIEQLANQFLHPLDDTRLHPDVYHRNNWAVKIAIDALERVDEETRNKEALAIKALRDVMENSGQEVERLFKATKAEWVKHYGPTFNASDWDPRVSVPADQWRDKVEELDLDTFALIIEQNGLGRWHSHLQMIKWEFRLPFADPRSPMKPLTGEKLFRLITGESDQSLRPGKEITGKIVRNGEFGSRVKLEGDIPAFIPLKNLADEHVEAAEDIVTVGTVVTAIVTEVKKDHLSVDLSLKMEDFKKPPSSWERPQSLPPIDNYFDRGAAARLEQQKSKEREARMEMLQLSLGGTKIGGEGSLNDPLQTKRRSGRVSRRACAHPAFRNARQDEVDRELREAGDSMVGEALIRPSSKGKDSLAVHWMVRPGCIKVIEVQEEDKDTDASIGNILKIKVRRRSTGSDLFTTSIDFIVILFSQNESYGSIDELLGRYIAPMNDYVEELVNHRKFIDLPEDELDDKLREQKKANPSGVFYYVCWMEMHPGYASLRFILSSNPKSHHIGITPNGFLWGSKAYTNLDKLLNDFKKNPRGGTASSMNSSTAAKETSLSKIGDSNRRSRWGAKPAAAPPAPPGWRPMPPPAPPQVPVPNNWAAPSVHAGAPPGQWGEAPSGQWVQPAAGQWGNPNPPHLPPHPGHFQPPPPSGPPPVGHPPLPTFGLPPPGPPPRGPPPPGYPFRPPPPPGAPPPNPRIHR